MAAQKRKKRVHSSKNRTSTRARSKGKTAAKKRTAKPKSGGRTSQRSTTPAKKRSSTAKKSSMKRQTKTSTKSKAKTKTKAKVSSKSRLKTAAKGKPKVRSSSKAKAARTVAKKSSKSKRDEAALRAGAKKASNAEAAKAGYLGGPVAPGIVKPQTVLAARKVSNAKVLSRQFLMDMADAIRNEVVPHIQQLKGREIVGTSASGDATFELDKVAERALLNFLKLAKKPVAYYSEDSGYTTFTSGQPTHLLVVDPIDGTRAAKSGFESCVVSIGSTRVIERPTIADLDNGCVAEILGNKTFYAERGKGARIYVDNHPRKPRLSENANLETVAWSMTVPARPAELIFPTAARLIDLTSLKGGFFACNSTSWSMTRLLTNQLDACVDFANRYYRDIPSVVEDAFINAGRGIVLGICPYDFCAAVLIAQEAGCVVTDAYGNSFDDVLLLDSSVTNHRSLIAAANKELHEKLLSFFDTRIQQYEKLLKKRVGPS
jgi:myo-inositol-1(or 4)-monophosphatase